MTEENKNSMEEIKLWDFIPIEDFKLPSPPVTQKVKKQIKFLKNIFKKKQEDQNAQLIDEIDLQKFPSEEMNLIAPNQSWEEAANSFQESIKNWQADETENATNIIALIGPPYSGYTDTLFEWATENNLKIIEPPSLQQILSCDDSWFSNSDENKIWIFPHLEKSFVRHAEGINLIRQFLDKALSGELGKGIIGCNSWAWNYIDHLWHGRSKIQITIQAFDQNKLMKYYQAAHKNGNKESFDFRQSDNGKYVISPDYPENSSHESSDFLQSLAAYSRGNLGVASTFWKSSAGFEADGISSEDKQEDQENKRKKTIWITPWNQLTKPEIPDKVGEDGALVLHSILIHNGLAVDLIKELLPLSSNQIMEIIQILEEAEILDVIDGIWTVTSSGYVAARDFVKSKGYLTDAF